MTHNELITKLDAIKNGTFFRCTYRSELPVKANYKKLGIHVFKVTEKTIRTGVNYEHLTSTLLKRENGNAATPKDNYETLVPNKIIRHKEKGTEYFRFANMPKANAKIKYVVEEFDGDIWFEPTELQLKEFVIPSYFGSKREVPPVQNVLVENIINIA